MSLIIELRIPNLHRPPQNALKCLQWTGNYRTSSSSLNNSSTRESLGGRVLFGLEANSFVSTTIVSSSSMSSSSFTSSCCNVPIVFSSSSSSSSTSSCFTVITVFSSLSSSSSSSAPAASASGVALLL